MTAQSEHLGPQPEMPHELRNATDPGAWDSIDERGWESFPASDPPGRAAEISDRGTEDAQSARERPGRKLLERLGRELVQAETSARLCCRHEAERLEPAPPAAALRACATHADEALRGMNEQRGGFDLPRSVAGALIGTALASIRGAITDRLLSREQSYRSALLGLRHGVDLVKIMNQLAQREGDVGLVEWTDAWLRVREPLVQEAENLLSWFALHSATAAQRPHPLLGRLG